MHHDQVRLLSRHSPDEPRIGVNRRDFPASLEARREVQAATDSSAARTVVEGADPAIFLVIQARYSRRLLLNA